jgi:BlaI family transcriptional regulator, penicillinase repressor
MKLTKAEEQVMRHLWKLEKAYMKNILQEFPESKPASTTLATILKRMKDKGFIDFNQHGSNREYYPLIKKNQYFSKQINLLVKDFFDNSASQFASFFTNETNLSIKDLENLKQIVDSKLDNDKKRK